MSLSEETLTESLRHCRALVDVADELQGIANRRAEEVSRTLHVWRGPHADTFRARIRAEDGIVGRCIVTLRSEADSWAQQWADAVNRENRRRHEAAVAETAARRGFGEHLVDLVVGDDSAEQVKEFVPVAVPSAHHGFAATGGLVHYYY